MTRDDPNTFEDTSRANESIRETLSEESGQILRAVKQQYDTFPFPPLTGIEQEDPSRDLRVSFNVEFDLQDERALKAGGRIWIPGCGTRWGVMTALQFRDVEIIASDFSEECLSVQRELARSLNIHNIDFRHENLLTTNYEREFDFISCVGVLHHLPNPAVGFQILSRALKPSGLAEIMVYDDWNRRFSIRMLRILSVIDPNHILDAAQRFELAKRVLISVKRHADVPREVRRVVKYLETSPGFDRELADFISHPQEHYFDAQSLISSLLAVGLSPRTWKQPHLFEPNLLLDDLDLKSTCLKMNSIRRAQLGQLLSSALLEVFVEHAGVASTPNSKDLSTRKVRAIPFGLRHRLKPDGSRVRTEEFSKIVRTDAELRFNACERRPAVAAYSKALDCITGAGRDLFSMSELGYQTALGPEHIAKIISLAREPITIGDIADEIVRDSPRGMILKDDVSALCDRLSRSPFRVLASLE